MRPVEVLLREHRRSLAVTEISWRRTDQLRDFVRVLKLSAVDLHDAIRISEENFGGRFDDARLTGTRRTEEQHRADRPIHRIHPSEKNLIEAAHAPYGAFLANNSGPETLFEILSARTFLIRVKKNGFVDLFFRGTHLFYFHLRNHGCYSGVAIDAIAAPRSSTHPPMQRTIRNDH